MTRRIMRGWNRHRLAQLQETAAYNRRTRRLRTDGTHARRDKIVAARINLRREA